MWKSACHDLAVYEQKMIKLEDKIEQQSQPDEELVDKIVETVIEHTAVDYSGKKLTTVYGLKCRTEIRKLLQSRQPEKVSVRRKHLDKALIRFLKTLDIIDFEEFLKGVGVNLIGDSMKWEDVLWPREKQ